MFCQVSKGEASTQSGRDSNTGFRHTNTHTFDRREQVQPTPAILSVMAPFRAAIMPNCRPMHAACMQPAAWLPAYVHCLPCRAATRLPSGSDRAIHAAWHRCAPICGAFALGPRGCTCYGSFDPWYLPPCGPAALDTLRTFRVNFRGLL